MIAVSSMGAIGFLFSTLTANSILEKSFQSLDVALQRIPFTPIRESWLKLSGNLAGRCEFQRLKSIDFVHNLANKIAIAKGRDVTILCVSPGGTRFDLKSDSDFSIAIERNFNSPLKLRLLSGKIGIASKNLSLNLKVGQAEYLLISASPIGLELIADTESLNFEIRNGSLAVNTIFKTEFLHSDPSILVFPAQADGKLTLDGKLISLTEHGIAILPSGLVIL